MIDYLIWFRVREEQLWLMHRGRTEALANVYKHFSTVICTHCSIMQFTDRQLLLSTLMIFTNEDVGKYVPDSAGDLGSEMETSRKNYHETIISSIS